MPQRKTKMVARGTPMGLTTTKAAIWDLPSDHEGAESDDETVSSVSYGNGSPDQASGQVPSTPQPITSRAKVATEHGYRDSTLGVQDHPEPTSSALSSDRSSRIRKAMQAYASSPNDVPGIRYDQESSSLDSEISEDQLSAANPNQAYQKAHFYSSLDASAGTSRGRPLASLWDGRPFPVYREGTIISFAPELLKMILRYPSKEVPGAQPNFRTGANLAITNRGHPKVWLSVPEKLPLRVGHFSYGTKEKIIIAQAAASRWEEGRPVIIVTSPIKGKWMIWRGQEQLEQIPWTDVRVVCTVKYADVDNAARMDDLGSSSPEKVPVGGFAGGVFDSTNKKVDQIAALRSGRSLESLLRARTRVQSTHPSPQSTAETLREFSVNQGGLGQIPQQQQQITPKRRRGTLKDAEDHVGRKGKQGMHHGGLLRQRGSDSVVEELEVAFAHEDTRTPIDRQSTQGEMPSAGEARVDVLQDPRTHSDGRPKFPPQAIKPHSTPNAPSEARLSVPRTSAKLEDQVIVIQDEPEPETEFDLDKVQVHFVTSTHMTLPRRWDFEYCGTIDRLFKRADGANIINSDIDKLTITVAGEKLNVMRGLDEDLDELVECIRRHKVGFIEVARGVRDTI